MKKLILTVTGILALALGIVGVFLPVLPTTPFVLLASFCFLHGSEKLHRWLLRQRFIGPFIENYMTYHAVTKRARIVSILFVWAMLILSMVLLDSWTIRGILFLVGIGVTLHLVLLHTRNRGQQISKEYKQEAKEVAE